MQLDWTTLLLQIVNFLILVWILKRFLYQPVLDIIHRRQQGIEQTLAKASDAEERAAQLERDYQARLADWDKERKRAHAKLLEELAAERNQRSKQLEQTLAEQRERDASLEQRRRDELQRQLETAALGQAGRFVGRLLERLSGPELDERLVATVIEDLGQLPDEQRRELAAAAAQPNATLRIETARPLNQATRDLLLDSLRGVLGKLPSIEDKLTPELVAGVRIALGPWLLAANLQDELSCFRNGAYRAD